MVGALLPLGATALGLALLVAAEPEPAATSRCTTGLDCSLNGKCSVTSGVCECASPWVGPVCGKLGYANATPASGFDLFPQSDPRNTWNGAIIRGPDGVFHLYNPVYKPGSLGGASNGPTSMMHGTATAVTGPCVL